MSGHHFRTLRSLPIRPFNGRGFGIRSHDGIRGFNCLSCFAYMESEKEFLNHLLEHKSKGYDHGCIQCADCLQLGGAELYTEHQYGSTLCAQIMLIRNRCSISSTSSHIQTPHYCPCGAIFESEHQLKDHEQHPRAHPFYSELATSPEYELICE